MKLFFAPMQGYTDWVYRKIHNEIVGGLDAYFIPFLRLDGGKVRNKDKRDICREHNEGVCVVPQVIASGREEVAALADVILEQGFDRVDLNLGCPFPLQTGRGRGAAALRYPEKVRDMLEELRTRDGLKVSVKMRMGMDDEAEGSAVVELLNDYELEYITIHPRLGIQQYKGTVDRMAFGRLMELSRHKVVYNGDVTSVEQIAGVLENFPGLYGVMMGRSLLGRPSLAREWRDGREWTMDERWDVSMRMHDRLYDYACRVLHGEQQILARMRAFWEYQEPLLGKKVYKRLMKTGSLKNYEESISAYMTETHF